MTTSTSVHSNAFNFMSFLQNGVDPRTGQYTVTIALPDVKSNGLRGPGVPLNLSYNPLNTQDIGYGLGWSLQLSEYDLGKQMLSLSTGENFKVTDSLGSRLLMEEQKIDSFRFYQDDGDGGTHYRVVHKSGLVEILEVRGTAERRVALPVRLFEPSGHGIILDYESFTTTHQQLRSIKDDQGTTLLEIRRKDASIEYLLNPIAGGEPLARFVMALEGVDKRVSTITLPTKNLASWRLAYGTFHGHVCVKAVDTPSGAHEDIFYEDGGHAFPPQSGNPPLPRVTKHLTRPGSGQPEIEVRYTYEHDEHDEHDEHRSPVQHNFLGGGLDIPWDGNGRDNLYEYVGNYNYACTESLYVKGSAAPVRIIERMFNQFHLLTREVTTQGSNILTEETTYNLLPDRPFKEQPKTCQLPHKVETVWKIKDQPTRVRSESVTSTYDDSGNLLTEEQADGVIESSIWYPAAGGDGCPADPEGFVRRLKEKTVTPANSTYGQAPTLVTRYRYKSLPAVDKSGRDNWLVTESETLVQTAPGTEQTLQSTVFDYIDTPAVPFQHGRVAKQVVTMGGQDTTTTYLYSTLASPEFGESVQRTVQTLTGFDRQEKVTTLEHSLLTGEPLLNSDDNGVEIRYHYDNLRRVREETVAPGTPYEASRRYEYYLCASTEDQAEQWLFDVKGVKTCTRFDGLSRAVYEERADADNPERAEDLRQTYSAVYDSFGNLAEETQYDWLHVEAADGSLEPQVLALTSSYEYDDWGNQRCVTGPDGVKTFEEIDPIGTQDSQGPIQRSWTESSGATPVQKSGVTETWLNLFEKPTRVERRDLAGKSVSLTRNHYDGLGRTVEEIDGFPERERLTLNTYDAFDRMTATTLPDSAIVHRTYAAHSDEDLPTLIRVEHNSKILVLGEQTFDGLNRMINSTTGGRARVLSYDPGQPQPKTVTTPSNKVIIYTYRPQLGEEPAQRRLPDATADYTYDAQNARLLDCVEQGEQLKMQYYSTGELKSEQRTTAGGNYTMHYRYSRLGRLQSYTDVLGQKQTYDFDSAGRLQQTVLGSTTSDFTYDPLGRTARIITTDNVSNNTVGIDLEYDDFGREIKRLFNLAGTEQTLAQTYDDSDSITTRTLTEGKAVIRDEDYGYDLRGRLTRYACTGIQPPVDPDGNVIKQQVFSFDGLDNLTLVTTTFDGGSKRARYFYEGDDPVQLSRVTITPISPPGPVVEIALAYDADGNLISDEAGRRLTYDALGRLLEVGTQPTGTQYRYDPLDKLTGETRNSVQDQRFYCDGELANQLKGTQSSTFMRGGDYLLAECQGTDTLLLGVNGSNSVLNEVTASAASAANAANANANAYTAYGHRSAERPAASKLGFNGELAEADTGWQLLGGGYRAYNPVLMRFHSPDSMSPFGEGGMNAYAYCEGDPVNFADPTGHTPWGALIRRLRAPLSSEMAKDSTFPEALLTNPKRTPTRLRKMTSETVEQLEKQAEVNINEETLAKKDLYKAGAVVAKFGKKTTGKAYERAIAARSSAEDALHNAQYLSAQTSKTYEYAKARVGERIITRYARSDLKTWAARQAKAAADDAAAQSWEIRMRGAEPRRFYNSGNRDQGKFDGL